MKRIGLVLLILLATRPASATSALVAKARSLYAKHNYPAAEKLYLSIPETSNEYLLTREELAWTYLRLNDWGALRGILPHLNSPLVRFDWRLEGRVLSAIAHLKDCEYGQVRDEIRNFQTEMRPFIAKIDAVLDNKSSLKKLTAHQREVWINRRDRAQEAITKMQFVRTEMQNQMNQLPIRNAALLQNSTTANIRTSNTQPDAQQVAEQKEIGASSDRRWILPGNRDLWSDEVFQMHSLSASLCQSLWEKK